MSWLTLVSTPGVVLARFQTLRPASGSSTTSRWPMVSAMAAVSVARNVVDAATVTVSLSVPTCRTALLRTTWFVGYLDARGLERLKALETVTVISYLPMRTN